jgi:hypothetical protein
VDRKYCNAAVADLENLLGQDVPVTIAAGAVGTVEGLDTTRERAKKIQR